MSIEYNFYTVTSLLMFILSVLFGIAIYSKDTKGSLNKAFGLLTLSVAGWSFFYYIWQLAEIESQALLYVRLLMAFAIFIPANFFYVVLSIADKLEEKKPLLIWAYLVSTVFLVLNATPLMVASVEPTRYHDLWPMAGPIFGSFLAVWFLIFLYPAVLLFQAYRNSVGAKKRQILLVLLGFLIAFLGGSTNYFLWFGIEIPPIGNAVGPIWVILVSYAIVKLNFLNIKLIAAEVSLYLVNGMLLFEMISSRGVNEFITRAIVLGVAATVTYIAIRSITKEQEQSRDLERQARQLEKDKKELLELDRMKDEFLQMATHELNTPITVIQGRLSMAITEDMCKLDDQQKKFLEPVLTNTTRLAELSKDILNVARIDQDRLTLNLTETDLDVLIDQIVTELAVKGKEKGNSIRYIRSSEALPKLTIDQSKVGEVITNLVDNADKFTKDGEVVVRAELKDDSVVVSIADTGIGIGEDDQRHIFEKFYQAGRFDPNDPQEQQGSGLGLYISGQIVRLHGGKIWFESAKGRGSTFYFSLPLERQRRNGSSKADALKDRIGVG